MPYHAGLISCNMTSVWLCMHTCTCTLLSWRCIYSLYSWNLYTQKICQQTLPVMGASSWPPVWQCWSPPPPSLPTHMIYSSPPQASAHAKCGTDLPVVCMHVRTCLKKCYLKAYYFSVFTQSYQHKNLTYCNNDCITYSTFFWYVFCQLSRSLIHNHNLILSREKRNYTNISHCLGARNVHLNIAYLVAIVS